MAEPSALDWATDYDIFDPAYVADPFPIWDELRDSCPIAHTDRYGGSWLPTRYEDVTAIAHDVAHFSSRERLGRAGARRRRRAVAGRPPADLVRSARAHLVASAPAAVVLPSTRGRVRGHDS